MSAVLKHCCLVWQTNSPADWRRNQILFALFHLKYIIINTHSFSLFLVSESQYKFISFDFVLHFHPALIFCRSCQTKFHTNRLTSSYFILDFGHVIIFVNRFRSVWEAAFSSRGTFRVCGKFEQSAECFLKFVCIHTQGDGGLLRESPPLSTNSRVQFSQCCFVYWSAVN